jgi:hypothetical protein
MARSWLVCVSLPFPLNKREEKKGVNVLNTFSFFSPPPTRKQDRDFFSFFFPDCCSTFIFSYESSNGSRENTEVIVLFF